jgi:hypothetical protein
MSYLCCLYLFTYTGVKRDFHIRLCLCRLTVTCSVLLKEQEMLTQSLVFCAVFIRPLCVFVLFPLAIALYALLRFMASDYSFGILKLFSWLLLVMYSC